MSQNIMVTLISLALYLSSIIGGNSNPIPAYNSPARPSSNITSSSTGVVTGNSVAVYQAIGSRQSVGQLQRGDYVDIVNREGSWYKVRLDNGTTGYIASFTLMPAAKGISTPSSSHAGKHTVLGYYITDSRTPSMNSLRAHYATLTAISPWTWEVKANGSLTPTFDTKDTANALKYAGERNLRTYALIHNLTLDAKGNHNFNATLAHNLLANPQARQRLVANIHRTLTDWRMSGVHIDFEMVLAKDRQNLVAFMRELYNTLHPAGFEVTMALPSKTRDSVTNSWSGGYDYAALARYTDQVMLMTYDEHWRGGPAGPVASLGWVDSVIRFALNDGVPASKIVLGIAGYGYDWPRRGNARALTYDQAMNLASNYKAKVMWDNQSKVPYFRYGDGRQVWFENRQSISHKLALVNKYNLAGISLWRLGQEDDGIWQVISDMLH